MTLLRTDVYVTGDTTLDKQAVCVELPQFGLCDYLHDQTGISLVLVTGTTSQFRKQIL